jgi:mRNA interferase MazF
MTRSKAPARPWRGEVWRVDFVNRPDDPHLPRPAIVISNDNRNDFSDSVLAIPISDEARGKLLPTHVFLPKGGGSGLTKDSRALCEQIASIDKKCFVEGPIGKLESTVLNSLVQALYKAVVN